MAPTVGGTGANDQYIDFQGTRGKYALLMVPDYDLDVPEKQASYMSLGASSIPTGTYSAWATFRGNTKGIRQHTDGQLVSTTRLERLDMVGGNYEVHVRGTTAPVNYPATGAGADARTFRATDQAYLRLGSQTTKDTLYLPVWLDADDAKKQEIQRIVDLITSEGEVRHFGWEDHNGGHRLSTTQGDKIEIIKGKSYIHVLGADDFDVSEGQKSIARSGSDPLAPGYDAAQNNDKRPFMVSRNWIRRAITETWVGVNMTKPDSKLPIDESIELTSFPDVIDGESREYTYGKKLSSWTGDSDHWVDDVEEHSYVHRSNTFTTADAINDVTTVKGAIAETTLVPFMTTTQVSILLNDVFVGIHTEVNIGITAEFKLGLVAAEFFAGFKFCYEIAGGFEMSGGPKKSLDLAGKEEIAASDVSIKLDELKTALKNTTISLKQSDLALVSETVAVNVKLGIA